MTHDLETTLNASVSSSPANKKIWKTPVLLRLGGDRPEDKSPFGDETLKSHFGPS